MSRGDKAVDEASIAESLPEQDILIQSVCETMVPKLVAEDIPLLFSLLSDVFPNVGYTRAEMTGLIYGLTLMIIQLNVELVLSIIFFAQVLKMKSGKYVLKNFWFVEKVTNKAELGWRRYFFFC